ncbi:oxysterol-binding protein, partial [Rhodotorula toruloides]
VFVHGDYCVRFSDNSETFHVRKPSSFVRNLVAGTKYLEVVGDLVVTTDSSSAQATISFKEGSSWGGSSTRNKIDGKVVDADGKLAVELVGRWDDAVDKKEGKNNFTRLWQIADFPPNPERYYGFSSFAVTLNETTPLEEGLVAPTDSRLRPDQLAFERGEVDEAERLKAQVEEKQRAKRKEGKVGEPRWFSKAASGEGWEYTGKYFEAREKKAFEDPDIFC